MKCERYGCGHDSIEHVRGTGPCNVIHPDNTACLCYQFQQVPDTPPQAVCDAIRTRYPNHAERILSELRYSSLNRCWFFTYAGMVHGVEPDGYIHT